MSGRRLLVLAAVVALVGVAALLADRLRPEPACTLRRDRLDPRSLQHVLPGSPPPRYLTDPPTSGPHAEGRLPGGVLAEPVPAPQQLGALEAGQVMVQVRPGLAPAQRARVEALAGPDLVVAPNPDLPAPIVATAPQRALLCSRVDEERLRAFAGDRR